jgi:Na+/alanine symporter
MYEGQGNSITMESLATVLGGAFLINVAIVLLWFCLTALMRDVFYKMVENWGFAVSRHEFDLVNYAGMALMKILNLVFFLSPYLAIKLWLRRRRQ